MIDPITSLAFSVHSGKGVYALLLGSGISRSAQIPTGWEITLDLIRRLASASNEICDPDPETWYREKSGTEPDYSALLESLANTPAERTSLLSSYFEGIAEDHRLGKKTPTAAHNAIARLASKGYFRVIVTTNFDRLMEQALEAEGINPSVISTSDMVSGAMPLAHARCTLIKVHGDYRDTRLRNTSTELAEYTSELNGILDRVFDEYGLIVCGWSATWDRALCNAILRCPNRRFTFFWGVKGTISPEAETIIQFRRAPKIEIESADRFFSTLEQKIDALESFDKPHPLSIPIAVATLKRFLSEDRFRIDLRDLVNGEVERQVQVFTPLSVQLKNLTNELAKQECLERMKFYESKMEMLIALIAHGCYYGKTDQASIWREAVLRIASIAILRSGSSILLALCRYPACILVYAGGIAAVASHNYVTLKNLFRDARTIRPLTFDNQDLELIRSVVPGQVVSKDILNTQAITPASDHLHQILRDSMRSLIPDDNAYDDLFDRLEYLLTLVYFDIDWSKRGAMPTWAPVGRFVWRNHDGGNFPPHVSSLLDEENRVQGSAWPPVRDGLFISNERFQQLSDAYKTNIFSGIERAYRLGMF
jgi:SIR2-like domain